MRISVYQSALLCVAVVALSFVPGCQNEDPNSQDGTPINAVGQSDGEIAQGINPDYKIPIVESFEESTNGLKATLQFSRADMAIAGTVENTTEIAAESVVIEVELSNKEKLGPITLENIEPGETRDVSLAVTDGNFNRWSVLQYVVTGGDPSAKPDEGNGDSSDDASGDGGSSDDGNSDDGNSDGGL